MSSTSTAFDTAISLSSEQKNDLLSRYRSGSEPEALTYGTVRDFCESSDHLSFLTHIQDDLKDLQRPAAFKSILRLAPPGARLLEVGAGEPFVAHALSEFGYAVTIVDPYDGSGNGPTEFQRYTDKYPQLKIIRDVLTEDVQGMEPGTFDCIYSISVLEHVHQPGLTHLFKGINRFLKPGGVSLHLVDHVLAGDGDEFHLRQLAEVLTLQSHLAGEPAIQTGVGLSSILTKLTGDIDTYYLSAEAHNRWRGATPYDSFPYRKVVSVHSCKRKATL